MQPARGFQMGKHQQMWSRLHNYGSVEDNSHNIVDSLEANLYR